MTPLDPENLFDRIVEAEKQAAVSKARLDTINGQLARGARATEKVAEDTGLLAIQVTALEGVVESHRIENKGDHKATRKELRLIGLTVAVATIGTKFIPTPTHDVAHAALKLIGLG